MEANILTCQSNFTSYLQRYFHAEIIYPYLGYYYHHPLWSSVIQKELKLHFLEALHRKMVW